jgi:hypothetical protein
MLIALGIIVVVFVLWVLAVRNSNRVEDSCCAVPAKVTTPAPTSTPAPKKAKVARKTTKKTVK